MRARALTTSIVSIFVLALAALPAGAATRHVAQARQISSTTTCDTPPSSAPSTPAAPAAAAGSPGAGAAIAASAGGAAYAADPARTAEMPTGCIIDGLAYPPADAPMAVKQAIWAANQIVGLPYVYGGGHTVNFQGRGYDCSGTVSYALHGGDLLDSPLDSSSFMRWGDRGPGQWITVYTNPGHAFVVIAGMRLDTSAAGDPAGNSGPQWRPVLRNTRGFRVRHPDGL